MSHSAPQADSEIVMARDAGELKKVGHLSGLVKRMSGDNLAKLTEDLADILVTPGVREAETPVVKEIHIHPDGRKYGVEAPRGTAARRSGKPMSGKMSRQNEHNPTTGPRR